MQAVNPTNIAKMTGNGNLEENGLYALLISRQEEIIGLVKLLLPKPTMKLCIIHITIIPLASLQITYVYTYSTNTIIKCLATLAVQAAHTVKCVNMSIALYLSCTLYILMATNVI